MAKTAKSENFSLLLQRKIRTILAAFTRITKSGEKRKKKKLEQMHQRDEEEEKEREKKKLNRKYKNNVHASALSMKWWDMLWECFCAGVPDVVRWIFMTCQRRLKIELRFREPSESDVRCSLTLVAWTSPPLIACVQSGLNHELTRPLPSRPNAVRHSNTGRRKMNMW